MKLFCLFLILTCLSGCVTTGAKREPVFREPRHFRDL